MAPLLLCPCGVAPPTDPGLKRILVAVDLREVPRAIVERAVFIARATGASIDLVHVRELFSHPLASEAENDRIDDALATMAQGIVDRGVPCVTTSLQGTPAARILAHAQKVEADLIVVGDRGSAISHALLGSVAERVLHHASCPVLVVPTGGRDLAAPAFPL